MRSLFSKVARSGSRDGSAPGSLVGRTVAVGPLTVRLEAPIGEGGFATIYAARDVATGEALALKVVKIGDDVDAAADCRQEVAVMRSLRGCPHILTLRAAAGGGLEGGEAAAAAAAAAPDTRSPPPLPGGAEAGPSPPPPAAVARPDEALLLMDLCTESLADRLRAVAAAAAAAAATAAPSAGSPAPSAGLVPPEAAAVFRDVCRAVAAMHAATPPLFHRDIKAENVLHHAAGRWVLCDFGSATSWAGVHTGADAVMMAEDEVRRRTTPAYRAPELFDLYTRERLDGQVDVWALGVLLYLLACGRLPFTVGADTNKLAVLGGRYPPLPPAVPAGLAALVSDLLVVPPAGRPPMAAVLARAEVLAADLLAGGGGAAAAAPAPAPPAPQPSPSSPPPAGRPTEPVPSPAPAPTAPASAAAAAAPAAVPPPSASSPSPRRLRSSKPAGFDAFTEEDGGGGGVGSPGPAASAPPPAVRAGNGGSPRPGFAMPAAAAPASGGSFWDKHAPTPAVVTAPVPQPPSPRPAPPAGPPPPPGDVEADLRRQLADALARNASLSAMVREQEATIRELRLAAARDPGDQAGDDGGCGGWANFGGEEEDGGGGGGGGDGGGGGADPFAAGLAEPVRAASEPTPVESWRLF